MSLRDRLEGRPRKTAVVRLARGNAEGLKVAVFEAARKLAEVRSDGFDDHLAAEALDDAQTRLEAEGEDVVEFGALPPSDFEAISAAHTLDDGKLDVDRMRPVLLAASAVDESLRDEEWWRESFASHRFSAGDQQTLWLAAYRVNAEFGTVGVPKG